MGLKLKPKFSTSGLDQPLYANKVLNTRPSALIGYWPLWDLSGSNAIDLKNGNPLTYNNPVLGNPGIQPSSPCPSFNGSTDICSFPAGTLSFLNGVGEFKPDAGTLMVWGKVSSSAIWTDGLSHVLVAFGVDANNGLLLLKNTMNNELQSRYVVGGVDQFISIDGVTTTDFFCFAMSWSVGANIEIAYLNGVNRGNTTMPVAAWVGALTAGRTEVAGILTVLHWSGFLAHIALWNDILSDTEIANLASLA